MRNVHGNAKGLVALAIVLSLLWETPAAQAEEKTVTVGTGVVTGVYYPAGGAICRLVNRGRKEHGIRCAVESTDGSINNLEGIREREFDLGIVQSDMLFHAYAGSDAFAQVGADKKLRALMALHAEPFTIVARKDAKISAFDDLKGQRVYMGAPGSGMRATMGELMARKGWSRETFTSVDDIKTSELAAALCGNKVDAALFAAGHPNGAVEQITSACATRLVSVTGPVIDRLIRENPFYSYAVIPGGMYAGSPRDTRTFGVRAVLVASADLPDAAAYHIVKGVFDNLDNFRTLHPVFATLDAGHMISDADMAPMHPGALKYYREKGLVD